MIRQIPTYVTHAQTTQRKPKILKRKNQILNNFLTFLVAPSVWSGELSIFDNRVTASICHLFHFQHHLLLQ
jgi:hypothetical protein